MRVALERTDIFWRLLRQHAVTEQAAWGLALVSCVGQFVGGVWAPGALQTISTILPGIGLLMTRSSRLSNRAFLDLLPVSRAQRTLAACAYDYALVAAGALVGALAAKTSALPMLGTAGPFVMASWFLWLGRGGMAGAAVGVIGAGLAGGLGGFQAELPKAMLGPTVLFIVILDLLLSYRGTLPPRQRSTPLHAPFVIPTRGKTSASPIFRVPFLGGSLLGLAMHSDPIAIPALCLLGGAIVGAFGPVTIGASTIMPIFLGLSSAAFLKNGAAAFLSTTPIPSGKVARKTIAAGLLLVIGVAVFRIIRESFSDFPKAFPPFSWNHRAAELLLGCLAFLTPLAISLNWRAGRKSPHLYVLAAIAVAAWFWAAFGDATPWLIRPAGLALSFVGIVVASVVVRRTLRTLEPGCT